MIFLKLCSVNLFYQFFLISFVFSRVHIFYFLFIFPILAPIFLIPSFLIFSSLFYVLFRMFFWTSCILPIFLICSNIFLVFILHPLSLSLTLIHLVHYPLVTFLSCWLSSSISPFIFQKIQFFFIILYRYLLSFIFFVFSSFCFYFSPALYIFNDNAFIF